MKKFYILLLFSVLCGWSVAQSGYPYIKNYTPDDYMAPGQIWAIGQDDHGLMYFGGNLGLYVFNGAQWYRYKFDRPNGFPVRSLLIIGDTVFVAGLGDFGYLLVRGKNFNFVSLADQLDSIDRLSFTNVWRVARTGNYVLFQADTIVFRYNLHSRKLKRFISGDMYRFLSEVDGKVYFSSSDRIYCYDGLGDDLQVYANDGTIKLNIVPYHGDTLLLCDHSTLEFLNLDNGKIFRTPELNALDSVFEGLFIYSAKYIPDKELYAIGTVEKGLYLLDKNFKIVLHIDQKDGLSSHSVLYIFSDLSGNLWLARDNGISVLNLGLPFSVYDSRLGLDGNPYDIAKLGDKFYAATHLSLYQYDRTKSKFEPISTDKGVNILQPFYIDTVRFSDGTTKLLIASARGLYVLENNVARALCPDVTFMFTYFDDFPDTIYYTTGYDLKKIVYRNGRFEQPQTMMSFSSLYVEAQPQGHFLWLIDEYSKDLIRVDVRKNKWRAYTAPVKINNGMYMGDSLYLFTSEKGLYSFDPIQGKFLESSCVLNKFFKNKYVNEIFSIGNNEFIAYSYNNEVSRLYRIKVNGDNVSVDSSIFNVVKSFYRVRVINRDVWILTFYNFVRYNLDAPIPDGQIRNPVIFRVYATNGKSLYSFPQPMAQLSLEISYKNNSLIVEYALPSYVVSGSPQFSYKLVKNGHGKWSQWTKDTKIRLLSLGEGRYTFYLKARDALGHESGIVSFSFHVRPPFYRSTVAYIVYFLIFIAVLFFLLKIREQKLKKEKEKLEKLVAQRTYEVQKQKQELQIQSENIRRINEMLQQRNSEANRLITQLQLANQKIVAQNKHIADSIEYAKRIQKSIFSHQEQIGNYFREWFVFYEPKDYVSGDFYWSETVGDKLFIAVADCTGHGIPGAFMSVLSYALLNQIVYKGVESTADLLEKLREEIIKMFLARKKESYVAREGLDIAVISIDLKTHELQFSGAFNPLIIIQHSGEFLEFKADRIPVGYMSQLKHFTYQTYQLQEGDKLYMFTDGFYDQINFKNNQKYYRKNFYEFLKKISPLPMNEQYEIIKTEFYTWRGDSIQVDDVLVLGLKVDLNLLK